MTELDLALKVQSRRLLWRMGFTTRIDVPLRAFAPAQSASATKPQRVVEADQSTESRRQTANRQSTSPESFTDLDVLGISIAPGFRARSVIVDCKTGSSSAISRMFWLRGLSEFFQADSTYMVRDRSISSGARQLARRLGIAALTGAEVVLLEELHPSRLPLDAEPLSLMFTEEHVAKVFERLASQDRRIKSLIDFQQFDYWVIDEHLKLMQVVEQLGRVSRHMQGTNPQHLGIVLDCAWLYILSLSHALEAIRDVHVSDVSYGLREYMMGGINRLREREQLEELFSGLQARGQIPSDVDVSALPSYFPDVLELATRLLRRGDLVVEAMRYLEVTSSLAIAGVRRTAPEAFGPSFDPVAGKLAHNVVAFLVKAAGLSPQYSILANELLTGMVPAPLPTDPASAQNPNAAEATTELSELNSSDSEAGRPLPNVVGEPTRARSAKAASNRAKKPRAEVKSAPAPLDLDLDT